MTPKNLRERAKNVIVDLVYSPMTLLRKIGLLSEGEVNWVDTAAEDFIEDWSDIEAVEGLSLIDITINAESRGLAMDIPNRMVQLLKKKTQSFTREGAETTQGFLTSQLVIAEENVAKAEEELNGFKRDHSIVMIDEEKRLKLARLDALEAEHEATRKMQREQVSRLAGIEEELGRLEERVVLETVIEKNPVATDLEISLKRLEIKLASLLVEQAGMHPEVLRLKAEIEENRKALKSVVQEILQRQKESFNPLYQELLSDAVDLRMQGLALKARETALQESIDGTRKDLEDLAGNDSKLLMLLKVLEINSSIYESLRVRLEEMSVEKMSDINEYNIRVLDRAYISDSQDSDWPMWALSIIAGLIFATLFGFGSIFLLEYWNDSIVGSRDVEHGLSVTFLGSVPHIKKT